MKKVKIDKAEKKEPTFLWELYTDKQLRLWPKGNKISYLSNCRTGSSMPEKFVNKNDGEIITPTKLPVDILAKHSISLAGFAEHGTGYYHSRQNEGFCDLTCVTRGKLEVKFDTVRKTLSKGDALIVPPRCLCDSFVETKSTELIWMHFKNTQYWLDIFGRGIFIKRLEYFDDIFALMRLLKNEAYRETPSVELLGELANALEFSIRREFGRKKKLLEDKTLEELFAKAKKNPELNWVAENAAKEFGVSAKTLDDYCLASRSESFSKSILKIRMNAALEILRDGKSNAEIAKEVGYADAYSFSKAFKRYYGKSPKHFF